MKRWVYAALAGIVILAVMVRFLPLLNFAVWGSDSGEYWAITKMLVSDGKLGGAYKGWGFGYPYFPGMFLLTGAASMVAGLPLFDCLAGAAPFAAAISVYLLLLITHRTFGDIRAGLVAGAFLAVTTPHVFSTSHPMPGSLGDMLSLLCILLLLKGLETRGALIGLGISAVALVMTHHLSSFFVLVPVLFALLIRELIRLKTDWTRTKIEAGFSIYFLSVTLLYWYAYAVPFRERVIPEGFQTSPWIMLAVAYLALLVIPALIWMRRRLLPKSVYRPKFPSFAKVAMMYGAFIVVTNLILVFTALYSMPGTAIDIDDRAALWFLPQMFFIAMAMAGTAYAEHSRDGLFVWAWLGALSLLFVLGTATNNHVLIPYRMTQYIIAPLTVFCGAGAIYLHDHWNTENVKKKAVSVGCVLALGIAAGAATAYPPKEILGGFEEGTTNDELVSTYWLREEFAHAELLATDHRLSSMAYGIAGINGSWDDAYDTLHGNASVARAQMQGLQTPSGMHPVSLVLLDKAMEGGVALVQWETAKPLAGEALEKFSSPLFVKVYESNRVRIYRPDLNQ